MIAMTGLLFLSFAAAAQEEKTQPEKRETIVEKAENKLKISGYLQGQAQWAESRGIKAFTDGGSFSGASNMRFGIRRGRIKFTYTAGIAQVVFQPDFTEKGVGIKDAYLKVTTKSKGIGGQLGLFDRPFGYEINYSSSLRETPERSRVFLSLFPGEREVGAMIQLNGKGILSDFTLNAGLFNGNGIGVETDSRKDFIGRLAWLRKREKSVLGAAFSYYNGAVMNPVDESYEYNKKTGFEKREGQKSSYEKREYFGFSAQYSQKWALGTTHIRAEYLFGQQPGTIKSNANPGGSSFGAGTEPLHLRKFNGYYAMLVQDLGSSKHSLVAKYDYYDPNTEISSAEIGRLNRTGSEDVAYATIGFGYLYRMTDNIRLMGYYDIVQNEHCPALKGFEERVKQNVFTARIQVKF